MRANTDEAGRGLRHSGDGTQFGYDSSAHELGVRIIEAVGTVEHIDEREITTPLSDSVDPEALDALFAGNASGQVSFEFIGHYVTVSVFEDGTGRIVVE